MGKINVRKILCSFPPTLSGSPHCQGSTWPSSISYAWPSIRHVQQLQNAIVELEQLVVGWKLQWNEWMQSINEFYCGCLIMLIALTKRDGGVRPVGYLPFEEIPNWIKRRRRCSWRWAQCHDRCSHMRIERRWRRIYCWSIESWTSLTSSSADRLWDKLFVDVRFAAFIFNDGWIKTESNWCHAGLARRVLDEAGQRCFLGSMVAWNTEFVYIPSTLNDLPLSVKNVGGTVYYGYTGMVKEH